MPKLKSTLVQVSCEKDGLENNLLVGQCCTEVLLYVGLQNSVKMLELSVSDQADDVNLSGKK